MRKKSLLNGTALILLVLNEKFIENWDMGENHLSEVSSFAVDESL
ncbi:hypothetical protein SAMN04487969_10320 [Paenibacillus algorifonticola]|uniref:Uncharacterized protein n=1 Tax=Paenibacillus algorifonticola TaxID=684063 RepID=A0A1I2AYB7_9BACL|nr:hypothetical protein [Paenibacillus algorifonticola]SFE48638.1 hypothetical protein SAMN04487969_10320 [Paenibacillus algorifonticola]